MNILMKIFDVLGSSVIMVFIAYLVVDVIDTKNLTASGLSGRIFTICMLMLALART